MKKLYIIKAGTTFAELKTRFRDFDQWTARALGPVAVDPGIVDAENGAPLPRAQGCAGVVITGSHAMVTDDLSWSRRLEDWIRRLLEKEVPIFGICYGHQLLARAAGGRVGFLPLGMEIGTVDIRRLPDACRDPVFRTLPHTFPAHATHSQTVLELPASAVRLAANDREPNHAYRLGKCAWGVQFHPEYDVNIMQSYIRKLAAGPDASRLLDAVSETPAAAQLVLNFAEFVIDRMPRQSK